MQIFKNKSTYKIPKHDQILTVILFYKKVGYMLQHRDIDFGIPTLTKGQPTSFSTNKLDKIEFYPIPNKNYKVIIQYMPLIKEI